MKCGNFTGSGAKILTPIICYSLPNTTLVQSLQYERPHLELCVTRSEDNKGMFKKIAAPSTFYSSIHEFLRILKIMVIQKFYTT